MGMMIHRRKEGHLHYPKVETKVETHVEAEAKESTKVEQEKKEVVYSREEINKLPFFSLKSIAIQQGIDVTGKKTAQLRADLIKKLEL